MLNEEVLMRRFKKTFIHASVFVAAVGAISLGIFTPNAYASTSGGSGGAYAWQTNQSFTGGGFTSKYHIDATGIDLNKSIGLVVDFHGDGAYGFNNPNSSYSLGGTNGIRAVAREYNMITVSALTPDRATGDLTWWWRGADYADYVYALINHIYSKYNIDKSRVWLEGYSGGAQFITQYYLPEYGGSGQIENGGSVVFGGGDDPSGGDPQHGTINPIPSSFKQNFRMFWGAGTADSADGTGWEGGYKSAQDGYAWYGNQGFVNRTTYYPQGWCHSTSNTCTSFESKFGTYLRQQLQSAYPNGIPSNPPSANDTTTPQVTLTASTANTAAGSDVVLSSTASDNVGVTKVEFYRGTTKLSEDSTSPYSYSWNTTGVEAGTYAITAMAYDAAGNNATSNIVNVTITAPANNNFTYTYNTSRTGLEMDVHAPSTVRKVQVTVSSYPFTDSRWQTSYNYDYNFTNSAGYVHLSIVNELTPSTKYYFTIKFDGVVVESGTMYTES